MNTLAKKKKKKQFPPLLTKEKTIQIDMNSNLNHETEREESIEFLPGEFNFDLEKFEKDKEKRFFEIDFLSISKNSLIRLSPHFHTEGKERTYN